MSKIARMRLSVFLNPLHLHDIYTLEGGEPIQARSSKVGSVENS